MADIAKLDMVLDYISMHPEEWEQASWGVRTACGTAFCVAGHVARIEGAELDWFEHTWRRSDGAAELMLRNADGVPIGLYAQQKLGVVGDQADELFHEDNSLGTLKRMRDALALNPGIRSGELYDIADDEGDR